MALKIDSHQHFWKYSPTEYSWISDKMGSIKKDFLGVDLDPILKSNNIDGCIAVQARQSPNDNEFLIKQAKLNSFVKGIVGWVSLTDYDLPEKLDGYADQKIIKGFRHSIQDEPDPKFMLNMQFIDGVKILDLYDYTYDLLIHEKQMPTTIKFLENFSSQKFVLDHLGKPNIKDRLSNNWKDSIKTLAQYPELYCKISGMVTEASWSDWSPDTFKRYLDIVTEEFGPSRLLFGSDWPVCLLAANKYEQVLKIIEDYYANFSEEEKSGIFGGNAIKFYGLET